MNGWKAGECLESAIYTTYKQTELHLCIQYIIMSQKNVNNLKKQIESEVGTQTMRR